MNRKKIENWVIFGLKLLPFLMLAIFAIYIHRHNLPDSVNIQVGTVIAPGEVGIVYEPQTINLQSIDPRIGTTKRYTIESVVDGYDIDTFYFDLGSYTFVGTDQRGFVNVEYNQITFDTPFIITSISVDSNNRILFEKPVIETYTSTLDIISFNFSEFLDHSINFNFFNINDFYNWTVSSWFNNNPPLIYKPIFIILIYELLVDLLVLMYSFITFVIKFAQKWLNGIYNKDW